MKHPTLAVALALALVGLAGILTPVAAAKGRCADAQAWPSFAEVAQSARSIYLAYEDEQLAVFQVQRTGKDERYSVMYVDRGGRAWGFGGYADTCGLRPLLEHDLGGSFWRVDAGAPPTPASTTVLVEVMEVGCASDQPATGRFAAPIVVYGDEAITVTIPVRPVMGGATCPGNPWTPFVLELDEPSGERLMLDGGPWPPEQRWPEL